MNTVLEWLRGIDPAAQMAIAATLAAWLTDGARVVLKRLGRELGDTPAAKMQKLLVALLGAALVAVALTGFTPLFWGAWFKAAAGAVFLHEAYRKTVDAGIESALSTEVQDDA
jgi:hypothetical protein